MLTVDLALPAEDDLAMEELFRRRGVFDHHHFGWRLHHAGAVGECGDD